MKNGDGSNQPNEIEANKEVKVSTVELSTPWGRENSNSNRCYSNGISIREESDSEIRHGGSSYDNTTNIATGILDPSEFIRERSIVHLQYIIEENKTKRLALVISALLVIAGGFILAYAPAANRVLANFIGIALVISAGGAAGYKRLWFRSRERQLLADSEHAPLPAVTPSRKRK
jgi:hypothetical protein